MSRCCRCCLCCSQAKRIRRAQAEAGNVLDSMILIRKIYCSNSIIHKSSTLARSLCSVPLRVVEIRLRKKMGSARLLQDEIKNIIFVTLPTTTPANRKFPPVKLILICIFLKFLLNTCKWDRTGNQVKYDLLRNPWFSYSHTNPASIKRDFSPSKFSHSFILSFLSFFCLSRPFDDGIVVLVVDDVLLDVVVHLGIFRGKFSFLFHLVIDR